MEIRSARNQVCPENRVALTCIFLLVKALIIFLCIQLTKLDLSLTEQCFCTSTARILALLLLLLCLNSIVLLLLFYAACSFKSNSRPPSPLYSLQCCCNTNRNWSTISICSHVSQIMESASKHTLLSPSKSVLQSILFYFQLKYHHHRYIYTVLRLPQQKTHYFEYKSWPK